VRRAVDDTLTERQRRIFVAIVVNGAPLDALVTELNTSPNAIYKGRSTPGARDEPGSSLTVT
jgi:RNA polymerase sigma-70 factor (ECF subfamily)